ncbi:High-affinity zinc uptake system ATP-binding protein ZnuC [Ensifer psoraleae]|nr:High-affinity zinc uptake system ATP-binding protein ZnuC [Sinorhizobium psoraleae]
MTDICLEFKNLTLGYQGHAAVHHLSGTAERGVLTAIVGANGSGKSTLMKGIAGILKPISGTFSTGYRRLAYLPQQSELDRSFPARVIDPVSLGFWQDRGLLGRITGRTGRSLPRALMPSDWQALRSALSKACPGGKCSVPYLRGRCSRMPI